MIILIYNLITYVLISKKLTLDLARRHAEWSGSTKELNQNPKAPPTQLQSTIRRFLFAIILCWTFALTNRIQNYCQPYQPVYWLYAAHGFLAPFQGIKKLLILVFIDFWEIGFCNSIIYGLNDEIRENYTRLFDRFWNCCCSQHTLSIQIQDDPAKKHIYYAIREYDEEAE